MNPEAGTAERISDEDLDSRAEAIREAGVFRNNFV